MRTSRVLKFTAAIICAAAATASLAACGSSTSSSGGSTGAIKIGLITKTDSNPYFVKLKESATAAAKENGAELVAVAGKFDGDNDGQVTAIENMVSQGVKGIMITPNSSTGILNAIKKARAQGVVVVALDTATEPESAVDATFATDNTAAGEKQGKWAKASLGSTKPILLMIDGTAGSTVDTFRHTGFLKGIGLTNDSPELVGHESGNGDQAKSLTAAENLLQAHAGANVIYTMNEPTARGAFQALTNAKLQDKVVLGSIDGSCQGVKDIKDGKLGATVMQFPAKMSKLGVEAIVKYAKDGTKPTGFVDTGSQLITDKPVAGLDAKDSAWGLSNCWG